MPKKKVDDIEEITELEYLKLAESTIGHQKIKLAMDEIDDYKLHGYAVKYFLNRTKNTVYYDFFERDRIGFKQGGENHD